MVTFLNNDHTKLSLIDCYESLWVTVGDLCFVSRTFDYSVVGQILLCCRSDAMEYFSSIVVNLVVIIDKCVIVHRDSERYC